MVLRNRTRAPTCASTGRGRTSLIRVAPLRPFALLLTDKAAFDKLSSQKGNRGLLHIATKRIKQVGSFLSGTVAFDEGYFGNVSKRIDCLFSLIKDCIEKFDRVCSSVRAVFSSLQSLQQDCPRPTLAKVGSVNGSTEFIEHEEASENRDGFGSCDGVGKVEDTILRLVHLFYSVCCCKEAVGVRNKILREKDSLQEQINSAEFRNAEAKEAKVREFGILKYKNDIIQKKLKVELEEIISEIEAELSAVMGAELLTQFNHLFQFGISQIEE